MAGSKAEATEEANVLINVGEFIVEWTDRTPAFDPDPVNNEKFIEIVSKKMGITTEMATELDSVCQLSSLSCEGEPSSIYSAPTAGKTWKDIPDDVTNLVSLNLQREDKKKRSKDVKYKYYLLRNLKYKELDFPWVHETKNRLHHEEISSVPRDAIVTMQVYDPVTPSKPLRILTEIHVLGQQTLTSARDKINCRLDQSVLGEFSEHPDLPQDTTAKDQFPSGFFFIEGTFYNDMRHPNSRDYSLVIRDWATKDPGRGLGPYSTVRMEDTTVDSLSFKLGRPYVYVHQADCEHLVVFSDIRLLHPEDCVKTDEYPLALIKYRPKPSKCRVCLRNAAVWLVHESPSAPEDPCFFCDTCYRMLHYDENGQKIGDFRTYSCKMIFDCT